MSQSATVDQLHHNVEMAVLLTEIVDCYNVEMGETSDQSSLLVETLDKVAISRIPWGENLDRNLAIKVLLVCCVDMSHASLAKRCQDFIFTKSGTNQGILLHSLGCVPLSRNQRLLKTKTVWPSWILS